MTDFVVKRHDTKPDLIATLTDSDGTIANLSTATSVKVIGSSRDTREVVFSRAPESATSLGVVTMPLQTGDTATAGIINVEVEVTWPTGRIQTFPADGYLRMKVVADLG